MSEDKFVTLVSRDPDRNPKWDGDVVFRTPTKEFLRLKGDGAILVEGRLASTDAELVATLKRWLQGSTIRGPDHRAQAFVPSGSGEVSFRSGFGCGEGQEGGDVVLEKTDPAAVAEREACARLLEEAIETGLLPLGLGDIAVWGRNMVLAIRERRRGDR